MKYLIALLFAVLAIVVGCVGVAGLAPAPCDAGPCTEGGIPPPK
jgi:hypothetical protein